MTSPTRARAPRSLPLPALIAAAALLLTGLLGPGCTDAPDDPGPTNPFDPAGPARGDPFAVRALRSGNGVMVQWDRPAHPAIAGYSILHSLDPPLFQEVGSVEASRDFFLHEDPAPGLVNYYKVQAVDARGEFSSISRVAADSVWTPPFVQIQAGAAKTPTRHVTLAVRSEFGNAVQIAANDTFGSPVLWPIAGDSVHHVPFDLGPAAANGTRKRVWVRLPLPGAPAGSDDIEVDFSPNVRLTKPGTVASRQVGLTIAAPGALRMRFALSAAGLASAPWRAAAPLATVEIAPALAPQTVHAEFEGDFGFNVSRQLPVTPDDLTSAVFVLAGGSPLTGTPTVPVHSQARALQMRFAQAPDLRGVDWQPYADTTSIVLTGGPGPITVYGQFRNDWADSPILSDTIVLVGSDLSVAVLSPAAGALLAAGTPLLVTGTAQAAAGGAALDSVQVDWGAGFRRAQGLQSWSILWPVPVTTAPTAATLRARAWAGGGSATVAVPVTIVP